jgi:hypothetical protein
VKFEAFTANKCAKIFSGDKQNSTLTRLTSQEDFNTLISVLTRIHHWTLPPTSQHPHTHYFFKIHFNNTFHLLSGLLNGLFPSSFSTKILYAFFISITDMLVCMSRPSHTPQYDYPNNTFILSICDFAIFKPKFRPTDV